MKNIQTTLRVTTAAAVSVTVSAAVTGFSGVSAYAANFANAINQMPPVMLTANMGFFENAVDVLQTLVIALGAGLGVWGLVNMLEGYGSDNPGSNGQG